MIDQILTFWGIVMFLGLIGAFVWLTKELPEATRLVRSGSDSSAFVCHILWVFCLMVITTILGFAWDFAV